MRASSDDPTCRLCGGEVDPTEDWCWGCHSFVCEECVGETLLIMGDHDWRDHEQVQ